MWAYPIQGWCWGWASLGRYRLNAYTEYKRITGKALLYLASAAHERCSARYMLPAGVQLLMTRYSDGMCIRRMHIPSVQRSNGMCIDPISSYAADGIYARALATVLRGMLPRSTGTNLADITRRPVLITEPLALTVAATASGQPSP